MSSPIITMQKVNGLKTGVTVFGEGQPIVLLHGWGGSIKSMWPVAERFGKLGFQTHTLDLPGFGVSDFPPEPWDVPRYAQFVLAYLQMAGLEKAHLIGHSFGGRISIFLSAEHPVFVDKLVLVDSAGVRPEPTTHMKIYLLTRQMIFTLLKMPGFRRFEPPVRQWFRQKYGSPDYLNAGPLEATFKLVINQDLVEFARRIQAPTLLIWGELDQETPVRDAKILEDAISDAGLIIFEGAGHYAYLERAADFTRIVTHFFRS